MEHSEWEEPIDERCVLRGLPPAGERTWRHPSELEPTLPIPIPTIPAKPISRSTLAIISLAGLASAVALALLLLPNDGGQVATVSSGSSTPLTTLSFSLSSTSAGWLGLAVTAGNSGPGVIVTDVVPGSPAAEAGLAAGDVLMSVDGISLHGVTDLADQLESSRPGGTVRLLVDRGGHTAEMDITLAAAPS